MLEISQLCVGIGGRQILTHVDLVLEAGDIGIVTGPVGSGKTRLLRAIAGLERPISGSVSLNGLEWSGSRWLPPWKRPLSMLLQEIGLWPGLTVFEHLLEVLPVSGERSRHARARQASALLDEWDMETLRNRQPHQLSGGQQQLVGLLRVFSRRPDVILLDEPTAHLDETQTVRVWDFVRRYCKHNRAIALCALHGSEMLPASKWFAVVDGHLKPS